MGRVFGMEIEYPLVVFNLAGARVNSDAALHRFFEIARESLDHLRDTDSLGIYLANGSRLYPDCGKVEWASPETTTPDDLCRYVIASGRMMSAIADRMSADKGIRQAYLGRHNVCYRPRPTTWACHASIGCKTAPEKMPAFLIPHLVSRIIYSGPGGFDGYHPGIRFLLSPRVAHLVDTTSHTSTHDRGIFHLKNEPLCRGQSRLHVLSGECLCSQTGLWLTQAATVLVTAVFDAGVRPDEIIQLRAALESMRTFAADPTCTARVADQSGRLWTAIEIQEHYRRLVERRIGDPQMPSWADTACSLWKSVLDRLQQGAEGVAQTLDWAIKLRLFRRHVEHSDLSWDAIEAWNQLCENWQRTGQVCDIEIGEDDPPEVTLALGLPTGRDVERLAPLMARLGLDWEQFPSFLKLQQQLFELDSRYGELTARGLFTALDDAGVLDHRIGSIERIDQALTTAPHDTRAALRGRMIREFHGKSQYVCNWSGIYDTNEHRYLDLTDPFARTETWVQRESAGRPLEMYLQRLRRGLLGQ